MFSAGEIKDIHIRTLDNGKQVVIIQGMDIPAEEFFSGVLYILADTKVTGEKDPKKLFVDIVKKLYIHDDKFVVQGEEFLLGDAYAFDLACRLWFKF